nr:ferric reductase-like transmembrane domain-containing protein [Motilibacter peucedani]
MTMTDDAVRPAPLLPAPAPAGTAPRRGFGGDVVGVAALLSVVYVVALWLSNRGLQDVTAGTAPAFTSLGRVTGLVSADLLLLQCLMLARLPWAERTWGQDRLARWHRLLGFTSFNLMLAHVVLITIGYAAVTAATCSASSGTSYGPTPACCSLPPARCSSCS